jgi:hypothetical protein
MTPDEAMRAKGDDYRKNREIWILGRGIFTAIAAQIDPNKGIEG